MGITDWIAHEGLFERFESQAGGHPSSADTRAICVISQATIRISCGSKRKPGPGERQISSPRRTATTVAPVCWRNRSVPISFPDAGLSGDSKNS